MTPGPKLNIGIAYPCNLPRHESLRIISRNTRIGRFYMLQLGRAGTGDRWNPWKTEFQIQYPGTSAGKDQAVARAIALISTTQEPTK